MKFLNNIDISKFLRFFLYLLIFFQPFNRFNSFREIGLYGLMLFLILKIFKDKAVSIDFRDKTIVALSFLVGWSVLVSILGPYPLDSINAIRKNLLVQMLIFLVIITEFKDIQGLKKLFWIVVASFSVVTFASITEVIQADWIYSHQLNRTHKMFISGYANNATFYLPFITAWLISIDKTKWEKWLGLTTLFAGIIIVFIYNSRTAILAIPTGILVILFLSKKYKLFIVSLTIFILCISLIFSSKSDTFSKYRSLSETETFTKMASRTFVWRGTLRIIEKRPFLGYGYGWKKIAWAVRDMDVAKHWKQHYPDTYSYFVLENANSGYGRVSPHNLILQVTFEIGLIGLIILIWAWITLILKIHLIFKSKDRNELQNFMVYSSGIIISYILISITNGLWHETYGNMLFFFFATLSVIYRNYENKKMLGRGECRSQ